MSSTDGIPRGYCQCGCGQKTRVPRTRDRRAGWEPGVPLAYAHGHNPAPHRKKVQYVEEDRGHATPCWIWQLSINRALGYGMVGLKGDDGRWTKHYAHRVYYEQARGPIPPGLVLDHLCRVRECCNPDHLEAVTQAENCRRGAQTKLTAGQVAEIRAAVHRNEPRAEIAARFGVHENTVYVIATHKQWREVA